MDIQHVNSKQVLLAALGQIALRLLQLPLLLTSSQLKLFIVLAGPFCFWVEAWSITSGCLSAAAAGASMRLPVSCSNGLTGRSSCQRLTQ